MKMVIVGSIGLDSVETAYGKAQRVLGGSVVYAAVAAKNFTKVGIVGVIGEDFPADFRKQIETQNICTLGLRQIEGKTFFWEGIYNERNCAETVQTQLNVFADFSPELPSIYCDCRILFLANIDPDLQLKVLKQVRAPELIAADTMNFWINGKPEKLSQVIAQIDLLFINDDELRMLTGIRNILSAAKEMLMKGPRYIVVKRGEHGAFIMGKNFLFFSPVYPVYDVVDPTGAGDSFAGGFLGYLASCGELSESEFRRAMIYGTVLASFNVENFSVEGIKKADPQSIKNRFQKMHKFVVYD